MRKLLLSACVAAAACWISNAGAMRAETMHKGEVSITKCESSDKRSLMVNRWELGNIRPNSEVRYLHIDYSDMNKKLRESEHNLTQEMKDMFYSLPTFIGNFSNLKVLSVHTCPTDNVTSYWNKVCLKALPDSIGNLKNLRILDLSDNCLTTLPDSIGNLTNLEELYLSRNRGFSKLPDSIGNLKNLEILELEGTSLDSLPDSIGNLVNLKDLSFSRSVGVEGPHSYGVCRSTERIFEKKDYSPDWYRRVINKSLEHWSCPTLNFDDKTSSLPLLDLSGKNLKQIPFGVYMLKGIQYKEESYGHRNVYNVPTLYATPALKELDVSNNQLTKISPLLKELWYLEKLYVHNNPNLNHLPDFLWSMSCLKELKIDGKLTRDVPENAKISLADKSLEKAVLDLTLASKNNTKISDKALAKKTGPYTVYLKKQNEI